MGRRVVPRGIWFNPRPWVVAAGTILFLVLALRQIPCVQTDPNNAVDAIIRLCYSDIPLTWISGGLGTGASPMGGEVLSYPPALAVLLMGLVALTKRLGFEVGVGVELEDQLAAAQAYYGLTMVVLFVCFLVWILTLMWSQPTRQRSWVALTVAASPVVLATGLISWELFGIALSSLAIFWLSRGKHLEAGLTLGLAASSASMPFAVILAVVVALGLREEIGKAVAVVISAVVSFLLVHVPVLIQDTGAVLGYYRGQMSGSVSHGSVWYFLGLTGWTPREAGSLGFLLLVVFLLVVISWLYLAQRTPQVGSLIAAFCFASMLLAAGFTPQMSLWLLFALMLARPSRAQVVAFTLAHVSYWAAIWGWLAGHLTREKNGPENIYWLTVLLRVGVDVWVVVSALRSSGAREDDELLGVDAAELAPDDLVEAGGRHAARDGDLVADSYERV